MFKYPPCNEIMILSTNTFVVDITTKHNPHPQLIRWWLFHTPCNQRWRTRLVVLFVPKIYLFLISLWDRSFDIISRFIREPFSLFSFLQLLFLNMDQARYLSLFDSNLISTTLIEKDTGTVKVNRRENIRCTYWGASIWTKPSCTFLLRGIWTCHVHTYNYYFLEYVLPLRKISYCVQI